MNLVLASASPRRLALLRESGIEPRVLVVEIDERPLAHEPPAATVLRLAEAKARAAAAKLGAPARDCIVLGADTEVVLDGRTLGKPRDEDEAVRMLLALAGRTHEVSTGVFLLRPADGRARGAIETSRVTFRPIDEAAARAYAATGEPLDKAGGYAIQGRARGFVERVEGSLANVVGLPVERLSDWIERLEAQEPDATRA